MMYTGDTGKHGDECCVWAACAARARRGPRAPRAGRVPRGPRAGRAPRGPSAARGPRGPREPRGPGAWSAPLFIETTLNSISTLQHLTTRTASHRPEPSKPREGGGVIKGTRGGTGSNRRNMEGRNGSQHEWGQGRRGNRGT